MLVVRRLPKNEADKEQQEDRRQEGIGYALCTLHLHRIKDDER